MTERTDKRKAILEKAGFVSLLLTLFLMSFPRSWSLYPLGFFLSVGLALWFMDFKNILRTFLKIWYLILPPVIYFLIHFISTVAQWAPISILETRLMFLLVPLLGFPVFFGDFTKSRLSVLFSGFTIGILLICIFLIIRLIFKIYNNYPGEIPLYSWLVEHDQDYSSLGFSILEHPTYLSLKINWILILLIFSDQFRGFKMTKSIFIILLLTVTLYLLASKTGLLLWFILLLIFFIKKIKEKPKPILYILMMLFFILIAGISIMEIPRTDRYITGIKSKLEGTQIDLKNLDQRTREWYCATQIIKKSPVFGTGFPKVEEIMVEEFNKNGFFEEAALRLNAHNQFLEAQMTFGVFGTFSLIFLLIAPIIFHRRIRFNRLIIAFVGIITFFLLIESMFNRQWGIMFFVLFYCILITNTKSNLLRDRHLSALN